mmetsp:Transcript_26006/g.48471  ORF Transcript_26006/g.48471 Transcript_26006/m.48471 type:complete len:394 (+) Transcript_26006:66-1247(+)
MKHKAISPLQFSIVKVAHVFIAAASCTASVDVSHDGVRNLFDLFHLFVVILLVGFWVFVHPVKSLIDHILQLLLVLSGDVVAKTLFIILESVLEVVQVRFQTVAGVDALLDLLIFLSVLFGFLNHAFDFIFRKTSLLGSNSDLLGLSSSLIFSRHLQDTVGVNFKGNFNLGNATGGRRDSSQFELSKHVVVLGHGSLSLVHLNQNDALVILVSRKGLRLLGRDSGTTVDKLGHDSTDSFDTLRERSDIQQQNFTGSVTSFTRQNTSLHCGSVCNSLIRVDTLGWFFSSKVFRNELLNLRNTSGSTDQHDFVDFTLAQVGIFHNTSNGSHGLLEQVIVQFFETGTCQSFTQVVSFGQVFNFQSGLLLRRQGTLDTFNFLTKLLQCSLVSRNIDI